MAFLIPARMWFRNCRTDYLLIVHVFALSVFEGAAALRCFECGHASGLVGRTVLTSMGYGAPDGRCSQDAFSLTPGDLAFVSGEEEDCIHCVKAVHAFPDGNLFVFRSCNQAAEENGTEVVDARTSGCSESKDEMGNQRITCYCHTDFCNTAAVKEYSLVPLRCL